MAVGHDPAPFSKQSFNSLAAIVHRASLLPLHDGDQLTSSGNYLGFNGFKGFLRVKLTARATKFQLVPIDPCRNSGLDKTKAATISRLGTVVVDTV